MWNELGISAGTAIIILLALYFVIKWAVKNGVKEAYKDLTGDDKVNTALHAIGDMCMEKAREESEKKENV